MAPPFLLVQLSDLHIGADWAGVDPAARLAAAVAAIGALPYAPDAVLVTGDLTNDGAEAEYAVARELLGRLEAPLHVLPGNHDDRAACRRAFGLPGEADAAVNYAVDLGPLRLVALDSTVPGQDPGRFAPEQLRWLEATLAAAPAQPTLLAMHHPPLGTGIPGWDEVNLAAAERRALGEVVGRHRQLRAIVAGHLHCVSASALAGCPVLAAPSCYLQAEPNFSSGEIEPDSEPPGFAVHALRDGELATHVLPLAC